MSWSQLDRAGCLYRAGIVIDEIDPEDHPGQEERWQQPEQNDRTMAEILNLNFHEWQVSDHQCEFHL